MEREANYAAVGAFVLLVIVMGGLFVYWYSDSREYRDYQRYEIYFEGSVSGLEQGSPVRYLGVDVGRVAAMRIDPRDPGRVQVIVEIDARTPVSERTIAELSLQGITGLLYIDLIRDNGSRKLSSVVPSERYPVIRSVRSNFDVLLASLPELIGIASNVAERAALLLSDENLGAISNTLSHIDQASASLPRTMADLQKLVAELRSATAEFNAVAVNARSVTESAGPEIITSLHRIREVADNLAKTSAHLDALVEDNRQDVRAFTRDALPELERFLREARSAATEIRDLSRSLREDPSQLLYQQRPQGLEIPR